MKAKITGTKKTERKSFGIRLDTTLVRHLKVVAAKRDMKVNRLLEEAILDLLRKYREI